MGEADDDQRIGESLEAITAERFHEWYQNRVFRQNIREGKPYFNGPSSIPPPERHSPSTLLQCHRKIYYRQENAPEEEDDPEGILWTGRRVEEDIVMPFLQDVVGTDQIYVRNSMWIDFTVEKDGNEFHIKGVTDPVIVDEESTPLMPTEVKTSSSLEYKESPSTHHRAQLHAYLAGLSNKYNSELTDGVIIYVSRETFEMEAFHVEFDADFWRETVVTWASRHTEYRCGNELPPAHPEYDWECQFCDYRQRCGKGVTEYGDHGSQGFLPGFTDYPREKVTEYLDGHPKEKLTPSLAQQYPDLVENYGVRNWYCSGCESEVDWKKVDVSKNPLCPICANRGTLSTLKLPTTKRHESTACTTESNSGEQA